MNKQSQYWVNQLLRLVKRSDIFSDARQQAYQTLNPAPAPSTRIGGVREGNRYTPYSAMDPYNPETPVIYRHPSDISHTGMSYEGPGDLTGAGMLYDSPQQQQQRSGMLYEEPTPQQQSRRLRREPALADPMVFAEEEAGVVDPYRPMTEYRRPTFGGQVGTTETVRGFGGSGPVTPTQAPNRFAQLQQMQPRDTGQAPVQMPPPTLAPQPMPQLAQGPSPIPQGYGQPQPSGPPQPQLPQPRTTRPPEQTSQPRTTPPPSRPRPSRIPEGYGRPQQAEARPTVAVPSRPRPSTRQAK